MSEMELVGLVCAGGILVASWAGDSGSNVKFNSRDMKELVWQSFGLATLSSQCPFHVCFRQTWKGQCKFPPTTAPSPTSCACPSASHLIYDHTSTSFALIQIMIAISALQLPCWHVHSRTNGRQQHPAVRIWTKHKAVQLDELFAFTGKGQGRLVSQLACCCNSCQVHAYGTSWPTYITGPAHVQRALQVGQKWHI